MMKAPNEKEYKRDDEDEQYFWSFKEALCVAGWIAAIIFITMFLPWMIKL